VVKAIEERLEQLRDEAEVLKSDMDAALARMRQHGAQADMRDIRTARWYRIATELRCFQDVSKYLASLRESAPTRFSDSVDDD